MQLTSAAFVDGGEIPRKYGCKGEDSNPPLSIKNVPPHAKSLALIMDDPDVPLEVRTDRMWVHWVIYNIAPDTVEIKENCGSIATLGKNTSGKLKYMGPCPPDKEHRYFFKLYALDSLLPLKEGATKEELLLAMQGHLLAETQLMGVYPKK